MIEVKVPKEVREYEEKWLLGMTKRQLLGCLLAAIINVPLYIKFKSCIGSELAGWVIILTSAPFIALGWCNFNGMSFEKLLKCIYKFEQTPQIRLFGTKNIYSYLKTEYEREESIDVTEKKKSKRKKEKSKREE